MEALIIYSFKLSVCLGVVYCFYYLALRKLTFYTWNRWFLISGTLLSFLIPLVNILPLLQNQEAENLLLVKAIPTLGNFTFTINGSKAEGNIWGAYFFNLLPFVFGLGLLIHGSRFAFQFISFFRLVRYATQLQNGSVKIYQVDKEIAPFSFGNAIFLNQHLHQPEELPGILKHELVHVSQKHTLDVVWLELLCLVNWFNPFAWLLRQAVRQNLEFIVDQEILDTAGLDKKYYQYLLLKVICLPELKIVNQFNVSSLKTRIVMMNQKPSRNRELAKFLLVFPLMALLLLACQDNLDSSLNNAALKQNGPPPPPPEPAIPQEPAIPPLPPPPPPKVISYEDLNEEHKAFINRNPQVELLGWQGGQTMVVFLKSGVREEYDLQNSKSRDLAVKKYGKLPLAPPPPPPSRL